MANSETFLTTEEEINENIERIANALEHIVRSLDELVLTVGGPWPKVLAEELQNHGIGTR